MKFFHCKHIAQIKKRQRGTLGKCYEELEELQDADNQNNVWHVMIESADLINSTYTFVWTKYKIPSFAIIFLACCIAIYKPIVRRFR